MRNCDSSLIPDHCSQKGALLLAARIKTYWIKAGYRGIQVSIERRTDMPEYIPSNPNYGDVFAIKTNIGPLGYPPS